MSKEMTFEENIKRLEEIVRLLEKGDAPLDSSLSLFEEGCKLVKNCSKALDDAQKKITVLTKNEVDSDE